MASLTVNPDYKLIGNNIKQMRTNHRCLSKAWQKRLIFPKPT